MVRSWAMRFTRSRGLTSLPQRAKSALLTDTHPAQVQYVRTCALLAAVVVGWCREDPKLLLRRLLDPFLL